MYISLLKNSVKIDDFSFNVNFVSSINSKALYVIMEDCGVYYNIES